MIPSAKRALAYLQMAGVALLIAAMTLLFIAGKIQEARKHDII